MCKEVFVIKKINKDTVYLYDLEGFKAHEMYRVSPPWNINQESVRIRDNKVDSGE